MSSAPRSSPDDQLRGVCGLHKTQDETASTARGSAQRKFFLKGSIAVPCCGAVGEGSGVAAAVTWIRSLARGLSYAMRAAIKKKQNKKKSIMSANFIVSDLTRKIVMFIIRLCSLFLGL